MKIQTLALVALVAAAPAAAQSAEAPLARSTTRGFALGAHLNGSSIQLGGSGSDAESGGGIGLMLGYGVSNRITLFARTDVAEVDYTGVEGSYTLAHVDLGARYSFASAARSLRPYVEASLQGAGVTDEIEGDDVSISGGGFGIGGGLEYFFNPKLALDVGLGVTGGNFSNAKVNGESVEDIDEDFTSSRFNIGISWHP
jgi:hypothetical protein